MPGRFLPIATALVQERVAKVFAQRESLPDGLFRVSVAKLCGLAMPFASHVSHRLVVNTDIRRILVILL